VITTASRRRSVWHASPRVIAAVLVVTALAALAVSQSGGSDDRDLLDGESVERYVAAMQALGAEGGQIVADGMKPGVADIASRTLPDEVLERMASGWLASMEEVRNEATALPAPGALAEAAVRFERAFIAYVRTAEALLSATRSEGSERDRLIDLAIASGSDADDLYDDALATLERLIARSAP
jgi:hypothetical protein